MPEGIVAWIRDFVDLHHEDQVFVKRRRDRVRTDIREDGRGDARIVQTTDVYRAPRRAVGKAELRRARGRDSALTQPRETDFWTRRKASVRAQAERDVKTAAPEVPDDERPDDEVLAELGLRDPDTMEAGDDFSAFMKAAVPDRIRRRALRKLWLTNPVLANLDQLVDYGEDFTDAATVVENLQTSYQVGKGMLRHVLANEETVGAEKTAEAVDDADTESDIEEVRRCRHRRIPGRSIGNRRPDGDSRRRCGWLRLMPAPNPFRSRSRGAGRGDADAAHAVSGHGMTVEGVANMEGKDVAATGTVETAAAVTVEIAAEDRMRAELYDFLGALLARPPDSELLEKTAALKGDDTELGLRDQRPGEDRAHGEPGIG